MYSVTPPVLYPNKCTSAFNRHVLIYVLYTSLQTFVDGRVGGQEGYWVSILLYIVSIHRKILCREGKLTAHTSAYLPHNPLQGCFHRVHNAVE